MKYAIVGAGGMARELREILIDMGASIEDIEFFVDSQYLGGELCQRLEHNHSKSHRVFWHRATAPSERNGIGSLRRQLPHSKRLCTQLLLSVQVLRLDKEALSPHNVI